MKQDDAVKRPIERSLLAGSSMFLLVLLCVLSVVSYVVLSTALHKRFNTKLNDVISFVEHQTDVDDLKRCIQTGEHSQKYDELQTLLNTMVDDFELEYLYIAIPSRDAMTNVISATSTRERAAGETDMGLLETTDAYSPQELERYLSYWENDTTSYFEESSDYGRYYTAVSPLKDSQGTTVALVCADVSAAALRQAMVGYVGGSIIATLLLFAVFWGISRLWIRKNITVPLVALEHNAIDFASKSHDVQEVSQFEFTPTMVHTNNEIEVLTQAMVKMENDVQTHVNQALAAQAHASEVELKNAQLEKEARSAAKIAELSESVTSLFTNMPGLTFSKDATTGVYLACNQAFAEYAHKSNPEGVVGLTDHQIFDEETARHFVDDDKKALEMDGPYVFFEDVFDAAGNPKQFQTTKMKFYDTKGRLCTLGMCVDVTELITAKRSTSEAWRAYEEARDASITYYGIARALSSDYKGLYYVDLKTDQYITYRHASNEGGMTLDGQGEDFFGFMRDLAHKVVYTPDLKNVLEAFTRENILQSIREVGTFTMSYRMILRGEPTFVGMKITGVEGDSDHLVVGISNIDVQMRRREARRRIQEEWATYERITALSGDYIVIYTVNPDTDHYVTYSSLPEYRDIITLTKGDDFFVDFLRRSEAVVHPDDIGMLDTLLIKERVVSEIRANGLFTMTYRLMMDGAPLYVRLRAALVEEHDGPKLVVGISNVDAQVKRDKEFVMAQSRASRDALTGVKNKHAYVDAEVTLDQSIEAGDPVEFSIVVCDINNLKLTNDTLGHHAGDQLIREACATICNVFKRSPVFRVGGDEFAVILQGHDYEHVDELTQTIVEQNDRNARTGGAVIAFGIATHQGDENVAAVFNRADTAMYENKRKLKGER